MIRTTTSLLLKAVKRNALSLHLFNICLYLLEKLHNSGFEIFRIKKCDFHNMANSDLLHYEREVMASLCGKEVTAALCSEESAERAEKAFRISKLEDDYLNQLEALDRRLEEEHQSSELYNAKYEIKELKAKIKELEIENRTLSEQIYEIEDLDQSSFGFYRKRTGTKANPKASNITLREEVKDNNNYESFINEFVLVIYAMHQQGMFVKFDESIKSKDQFCNQKKATLREVFKAFGNAVNIENLEDYNTYIQNIKKVSFDPEDNPYVNYFDNLKSVIVNMFKENLKK